MRGKHGAFCTVIGMLLTAQGQDPEWWTNWEMPVLTGDSTNHHGPANLGQAKLMVAAALEALRIERPDLATQVEAELIGANKPIPTLDPPTTQAAIEANYSPLNLGQLKSISTPFYDVLHNETTTSSWLDSELIHAQTKDPNDSSNHYPWTSSTADDANYGIANLGQLKAVFSLRLEKTPSGMSQSWVDAQLARLAAWGIPLTKLRREEDYDGDGLTNYFEFLMGTDPFDVDSDGDGLVDSEDLDPSNPEVNAVTIVGTLRILTPDRR
ncbi:hypothetical protein HNR46_003567 [Haloferula luteola]|uniref:Uncharacterized protein n=1 Tax=Haloferula luteola TaxID=595692 RepID=A0A840VKY2_9BACT|nr:thrombospondin type 3 repeat-containing protein [Haloferula luteola]MBB5353311.1 hypothetical protein [Haloferula luteola]